jgi:hypothetical protein
MPSVIGSWRLWEIKEEWEAYKPHLVRLSQARTLVDFGHAFTNAFFVEFFRCFAYTLGHAIWLVIGAGILIWLL